MNALSKADQRVELAQALEVLEQACLRRTRPRIAILKILIAHHGPFTVDEILSLKGAQGLDKVTVYRSLSALEEINLIQRCELGDRISRYEYERGGHHHHHVVCKNCKKVEIFDKCIPNELTRAVHKMGYQDVSHSLEFFGLCESCTVAAQT